MITGLLDRREGIHVLDLHLHAERFIRPAPHRDIHIAAQRSLLHVAVANTQIAHDPADLGGVFRRLPAGAQIGLAHDLSQGHSGAVVNDQGVGAAPQAIIAGVHELAGVFLHMQPLDADRLEVSVLALLGHLHLNPAVLGDRLVVLGDLVVLGQIGIEVLFAVELAVLGHLQVESQGRLHRILQHLFIQHRQSAGEPEHHRIMWVLGSSPKVVRRR